MMLRGRVAVIAHRGASADAPESTEAAIRRAVALGADAVELDVQMTKDGRLVVFHDERLERTTNGHGRLLQWHYRDLRRLDCGSWFAPRFADQRLLLVSQALRLAPRHCLVNLELKATPRKDLLIRRLVKCLRRMRAVRRVLVSSFDSTLLARMKSAKPQAAIALLCRRAWRQALWKAIELGCIAIHPHKSLISRTLIRQTHAAGLYVHVWTVDRLNEAERLIRLGVDGLFTNAPARLVRLR